MGDRADDFKHGQRQVWSIGDHGAMAEHYRDAADDLIRRLDVGPGVRLLDIGTGTGNAALAAARAGADVVGLDLTPEMFDEARWREEELGVRIDWRTGDAESMPFDDDEFDAVTSAFAMMFLPRPARACLELARVLRPGGRFALCNWSFTGAVRQVFEAVGGVALPVGVPELSPMPWGEPEAVRALFLGCPVELEFDRGGVEWMFSSAEEGVRWIEEVSGPLIAAKAALLAAGRWDAARRRLVDAVAEMTRSDMPGVWVRADYLVTLGTRVD